MKFLVLFVAVFALARAGDDTTDEELAKAFIACATKAMDGGLPSVGIPDHNPLWIRNFTYSGSPIPYTSINFTVSNNILYSLIDFEFREISATAFHNPEKVLFDYDIYWPILNFTGDFHIDLVAPLVNSTFDGSYNIIMREVDWTGIFNITKPGQTDVAESLEEFTLNSVTESVSVTFDTEGTGASVAASAIQFGLQQLMNHFPSSAADFLKANRFNGFWLANPDKIDAVIANC